LYLIVLYCRFIKCHSLYLGSSVKKETKNDVENTNCSKCTIKMTLVLLVIFDEIQIAPNVLYCINYIEFTNCIWQNIFLNKKKKLFTRSSASYSSSSSSKSIWSSILSLNSSSGLIGSDKNFGFDSSDWSKNLLVVWPKNLLFDWSKNVLLDSLDWSKNLLFDSLNFESSTIELRGLERSANVSENCSLKFFETFSKNIFKA